MNGREGNFIKTPAQTFKAEHAALLIATGLSIEKGCSYTVIKNASRGLYAPCATVEIKSYEADGFFPY